MGPTPNRSGSQAPSPREPKEELASLREWLVLFEAMAGAVSHDLKNPLSALLLGIQRLGKLADEGHRPQAAALTARLESSLHGMNHLLDGLQDLSRHRCSESPHGGHPSPIPEILRRAALGIAPLADQRKQSLEVSLSRDLPPLFECDGERMATALTHLLGHALHLLPDGATVLLSAAVELQELVLCVSNPGAALLPSGLKAPAEPRCQTSIPGLHQEPLGLLLARCLIAPLGGHLEVERDLGRCPVFRVRIPAKAPSERRSI